MISAARLAIAFGFAGLIPFLVGTLAVATCPEADTEWVELFYIYSAGILAFMAGVYWPIALQLDDGCHYPLSPVWTLLISQLFFLTAGLALLLPLQGQAIFYPISYLLLYFVDVRLMRLYWPTWYLRLRLLLTSVACLSQLVVAASFVMG
ncbi:uncharacterized protein DUF3429 [Tamilnaduibacter salinus]|uniref:Aspartate kinase n=1 Tax=Tamilnaduibacter salinus TaxID=1484056 RepID=A0A2A2HZI5_9GAMM|nr:DUF3429 domain-containing protein [Tamilnaduibacter salinus]PAV24528.1 aspartate kinase [Tamilnaduibacter salinus]PVY77391.1 uncharacterized protein DUF3429 [Tamilnaduibacter salinus]